MSETTNFKWYVMRAISGKEAKVNIGKFGPYIQLDGKYHSVPKDIDILSITVDKAKEIIAEDIRKILLYIDLYNMEKSKNCNYVFGIVNDYLEHGIEEVSNEVLDTALKMDRAYYQDYIKSDKVISGIKALSFNDDDMYHALAVLDLDCVFNDSDFNSYRFKMFKEERQNIVDRLQFNALSKIKTMNNSNVIGIKKFWKEPLDEDLQNAGKTLVLLNYLLMRITSISYKAKNIKNALPVEVIIDNNKFNYVYTYKQPALYDIRSVSNLFINIIDKISKLY